ncbi:MAG TPA: class I SAM-dependent methyltransferase [Longimicrobiaceae bacterium]|nr:class I SAM-dependent methyltransferase [Longimicrobiaceae bacterium]
MPPRVFPHRFARLLELPWRRLVLSPQALAARLPLRADSHVLEVGAGSGYYGVEVAKHVPRGRSVMFDVQPEMLERARAKTAAAGLSHAGFATADAAALPFAAATFDVVFMVTVFGELGDAGACLREARRVLRPAGTLSISEHLPDPDFSAFASVQRVVERNGFTVLDRLGPRWAWTANFRLA